MDDAEFDSTKRMMEEAEKKDALMQKLDSVTKLEVWEGGGGGEAGRRKEGPVGRGREEEGGGPWGEAGRRKEGARGERQGGGRRGPWGTSR